MTQNERELAAILERMGKMGEEKAPSIILDKSAVDLIIARIKELERQVEFHRLPGPS